jgi:hypothetical protein
MEFSLQGKSTAVKNFSDMALIVNVHSTTDGAIQRILATTPSQCVQYVLSIILQLPICVRQVGVLLDKVQYADDTKYSNAVIARELIWHLKAHIHRRDKQEMQHVMK